MRPQTYFCGPSVLAKAIKDATIKHTSSSVDFTFAKVRSLSMCSSWRGSYHPSIGTLLIVFNTPLLFLRPSVHYCKVILEIEIYVDSSGYMCF